MRNIIYLVIITMFAHMLTSCNDSEKSLPVSTENTEPIPTPSFTPTPTSIIKPTLPTCYIDRGTPITETLITIYIRCRGGNIAIDEATVTVDNKVKLVDYKKSCINDYISFKNLQPNTKYTVKLEVILDGETVRKDITIKTKKVKSTSTPTPTPRPTPLPTKNTAPQWEKDFYGDITLIRSEATIINLTSISFDKEDDPISYSITDRDVSYDELIDCGETKMPVFKPVEDIYIEKGYLKVKNMPTCGINDITVTIKAKAKGGHNQTKINFSLLPTKNTAPQWEKDFYGDITLIRSEATIINLASISFDKEDDPISYNIIERDIAYDKLIDCGESNITTFKPIDDIYVEKGYLKVKHMPSCGINDITVTVKAKAKGGDSQTKINFLLNLNYHE